MNVLLQHFPCLFIVLREDTIEVHHLHIIHPWPLLSRLFFFEQWRNDNFGCHFVHMYFLLVLEVNLIMVLPALNPLLIVHDGSQAIE